MILVPLRVPSAIPIPVCFQALDRTKAVTRYQRHLPHFRQEGATYFLTFRLRDAIPAELALELHELVEVWRKRLHEDYQTGNMELNNAGMAAFEQHRRSLAIRTEQILDAGAGACWMRDAELRQIVVDSIRHFDGTRLNLFACVVMPNHVHVLFQPFTGHEPEDLAGAWKQFTAGKINQKLHLSGSLWQEESWDRIVRDGDHFRQVDRYIARNPIQANLTHHEASVWLRDDLVAPVEGGLVREEGDHYLTSPW